MYNYETRIWGVLMQCVWLAEYLHVSQQAVFNHRTKIGKIQKIGKWVPYELNDRNMETQKLLRNFARTIQKMGMEM